MSLSSRANLRVVGQRKEELPLILVLLDLGAAVADLMKVGHRWVRASPLRCACPAPGECVCVHTAIHKYWNAGRGTCPSVEGKVSRAARWGMDTRPTDPLVADHVQPRHLPRAQRGHHHEA